MSTGRRLVFWVVSSQIVTSLGNFATSVLLVRSLGLDGFGQFSLIFIGMMIARNFLNTVVLVPMSAIAPKLRDTTLISYRGFVLLEALGFAVISSAMLAVLALIGAYLGQAWFRDALVPMVVANSLAILSDFYRRYFFVYERAHLAFLIDAVRFGTQMAIILVLSSIAGLLTVSTALWAITVGGILGALIGVSSFGRFTMRRRFLVTVWDRHWAFGKWMLPSTLLEIGLGNGPILMVGGFLGDSVLGLVRAIQQITNAMNLPFHALTQIAPSWVSRKLQGQGFRPALRLLAKLTVVAFTFVSATSVAILVAGDLLLANLMNILDPQAVVVLLAFFGFNAVLLLRFPLVTLAQARERSKALTLSNLVGLIVMAAVSYPAISFFGAVGAPMTSILAFLGCILVLLPQLRDDAYTGQSR